MESVSIPVLHPCLLLKSTNCALAIARGGFDGGRTFVTDQQKCLTTTNPTYNTFPALSGYLPALPHSDEAKAFQNGVTPILSMFFNMRGQTSNASFLTTPEVKLSCVRTFPKNQQQAEVNGAHTERTFASLILHGLVILAATIILV